MIFDGLSQLGCSNSVILRQDKVIEFSVSTCSVLVFKTVLTYPPYFFVHFDHKMVHTKL